MKVSFTDPAEFLAEIEAMTLEGLGRVRDKTVRFRKDSVPEQPDRISFRVGCWLTAVCETEDGEVLLECAVVTGIDRAATRARPEPDTTGSDAVEKIHAKLCEVCQECKLSVRAGKIELF